MNAGTKKITLCALFAALGTVVLLLGGALGIGTYAGPILAGFLLIPVQYEYGWRWTLPVWLITGVLTLMLSPDREMGLIYLLLLGWYPAAKPVFDRLGILGWVLKFLAFNGLAIALYAALFAVLGMAELGFATVGSALLLLAMGNVLFLLYDFALKKLTGLYGAKLRRRLFPGNRR